MSKYTRRIRIEAPRGDVWAATRDVASWPTWAPQFERLERLDTGPIGLGARTRVKPKGLPASIWTVSEFEDGRLFTWASSLGPGMRLIGGHQLTSAGDSTDAEFWLQATGPVGAFLSPLLHRTIFRRNTTAATEGLKRYVEKAKTSPT